MGAHSLPSVEDVVPEPAPQDDTTKVPEEEVDQTVEPAKPKSAGDWLSERKALWKRDSPMLKKSDKAMFRMLREQLHDKSSAQWAHYLRHQGMRPSSPLGHTWKSGSDTNHGALEELNQDLKKKSRLCDTSVKQHHGYFRIKGGKDKNYFYWMFEARENPKNAPLVLWLTGGPGCSSEIALFTENGPCSVSKDGKKTTPNAYSWNRKANLLFVDQPAGTGFSYGRTGDYDKNEHEVSTDLYHFLQEVVKKYPQYHKAPLYIFGESYAGHFVPSTTHRVFQGNQAKTGEYLALRGQGIGNGLTDAYTQYPYYPETAFN